MDSEEIRELFRKEFTSVQSARTQIHKEFSEQGIKFIENRREFIKTLLIISVGFIATPKILNLEYSSTLYYFGLAFFIATAIISLMYLKEYTDSDEAGVTKLRNVSIAAISKRLDFVGEYLGKENLIGGDANEYYQKWKSTLELQELDEMAKNNEGFLSVIKNNNNDYPTSFLMFLFVSGVFFLLVSVFYSEIPISFIILSLVAIIFLTTQKVATKIIYIYYRLMSFSQKNI